MAAERRDQTEIPGRAESRSLDVLLGRLATRQSGAVDRSQLEALGFSRNEIGHRIGVGRVIRVHQGVYAVGHEALGDGGRAVAALLAAGAGAALSHQAVPGLLVNHRTGAHTVDFAWPELVVETDGRHARGNRLAIERDHARDAALQSRGYRVLRFTWRQVVGEPLLVAARLAPLLVRA